jgi:MFS family permease
MNKRNIRLMYAIALLQGMVFYGPIATLYRQAQGVSVFQITIIESISLALWIALEIPWGYVADRIGYKTTLIICNILFFISKIVFWQAAGFVGFLAERLLLSVVMAGLSGCDSAYLYLSAGEKNSHKVFGVYSAMGTAGLVAAAVVYSAAVGDDYRLAGFLTVVSYGVSMVLAFFLGEAAPREKRSAGFKKSIGSILAEIRDNRRFLIFLAAATLLVQSDQTLTVFLSQVQYVRAGIPAKYMGYIYVALTLAGILAAASGRFTERIGENRICLILFAGAAIACGAMAITLSPVLSVALIILIRVCASIFAPLSMKIQNRQVRIADRATLLSVYSSVMNTGAVFTNLIFGRLADIDTGLAFGMGAVFCALGLVLYAVWAKKSGRTAP